MEKSPKMEPQDYKWKSPKAQHRSFPGPPPHPSTGRRRPRACKPRWPYHPGVFFTFVFFCLCICISLSLSLSLSLSRSEETKSLQTSLAIPTQWFSLRFLFMSLQVGRVSDCNLLAQLGACELVYVWLEIACKPHLHDVVKFKSSKAKFVGKGNVITCANQITTDDVSYPIVILSLSLSLSQPEEITLDGNFSSIVIFL